MRALLTGAAGFVGSHLAERLVADGFDVVGVDNLSTGRRSNLATLQTNEHLTLLEADAAQPIPTDGPLDWVLHLASAASPIDYRALPIETLRVNSEGTRHLLDLAAAKGARFLLASSSEVYGDPEVHPQPESYHGNVDPSGPRSVYQEAKRYAEAITAAYASTRGISVRLARIFNAYGPRMRPNDGRVISTFVTQALRREPVTVHGGGGHTRSFQYVSDLVDGLRRLMDVDYRHPLNIGSPAEISVLELANLVLKMTGSDSVLSYVEGTSDDPRRRCPDISLAKSVLGWEPVTPLEEGLRLTIDHFRADLVAQRPR
ncbi:MAG: UDP-glucuronic acid decarboxylase family protein [Candidatus Limnocylindrales bacterium]